MGYKSLKYNKIIIKIINCIEITLHQHIECLGYSSVTPLVHTSLVKLHYTMMTEPRVLLCNSIRGVHGSFNSDSSPVNNFWLKIVFDSWNSLWAQLFFNFRYCFLERIGIHYSFHLQKGRVWCYIHKAHTRQGEPAFPCLRKFLFYCLFVFQISTSMSHSFIHWCNKLSLSTWLGILNSDLL